ncbi:MAG: DUF84 family protein [Clostridia bacterium]|nr:DUF84 family protein [Clostridia bacterium]
MKILVGSTNESKLLGIKEAFLRYHKDVEVSGVKCDSLVPDEPIQEDIYLGACNRVKNLKNYALSNSLEMDYFVAVETGLMVLAGKWYNVSIAVIEDNESFHSYGMSPAYPIPNSLVDEIKSKDLAHVIDRVFDIDKSKPREKIHGGVSLLTLGITTRVDLTRDAVIMAMIPLNCDKWSLN